MKVIHSLLISINSGTALILFVVSFFLLLVGVAISPAIERNFIGAGTILAGAFGGYLVKRNANNNLMLEADKAGLCNGTEAGTSSEPGKD